MKKAFTIIEVLVVIVIIGLLTALSAYIYAASLARSRDSQRISDMRSIQNSLEQSYLDNRQYPVFQDEAPVVLQAKFQLEAGFDCQESGKNYLAPRYLASIPEDPSYKVTGNACNGAAFGHYLYFGQPKDTSKTGFVLMARMERAAVINWQASVGSELENLGYDFFDNVTPCDASSFASTPALCSHNYFLKNSLNN